MIRTETVSKTYKTGAKALQDVSIDIAKGEFVFVVGPSGSGKSTLIRLILREEDPTQGRIYVAGKDIGKMSAWKIPYLRRNIGTVFQDFKLLPDRTVYDNVGFALEVIGKPRHVIQPRVPQILQLVGLGDKLEQLPGRAVRRRAAAGVDRPGLRQPAADPAGRRAHREPRPGHLGGHHEAPRPDQPDRHHRGDGHPRQRDRGRHAPPGRRAGEGPRRPRPGPRGVRYGA